MKAKRLLLFCFGLFLVVVCGLEATASIPSLKASFQTTKVTAVKTNYRGWRDSWVLSNGQVEAVIVPAIGRVMQFRFQNGEDTFWENPKMSGKIPNPTPKKWVNFGGDKTWPAPQSDWKKIMGRLWPPPTGFDSIPVQAKVDGGEVTLIYPIDLLYGIRTFRRIRLHPQQPVMTISTTFEKVKGKPKDVAVWVITQLRDPVAVYAALPQPSIFPQGYNKQSDDLPANLKVENGMLSLTRDPKKSHKLGCDASTLLWVGKKVVVRIDSPRVSGVRYPDQESSAEIYTNSDPEAFVELEFLSPLKTLQIKEKITLTTTYTLLPRTTSNPDQEASQIIGR
ncbi:MAG: DUF4380 domain-containing protein [Mojavia pulchra JT2-VF2]|jgi:hypothetical protein|uniref:DUF4380 domain-containing protein n=1 Tax=Mojavia pulchra JT2-VF2 TaxID=287848 RepID=A0A951UHH6_9NOST|nr:DUF4380 domain-containing protein [Mojavia pulchra JT2-VF2]